MKSIQSTNYPVHFQETAYEKLNSFLRDKNYSSIVVLVDDCTFEHCYPKLIRELETTISTKLIQIPSGEIHKNITTCVTVWNKMTELNIDRHSLLIALGGGVVTDLGGFVAASYKRGIDFVNIPTTLLSMVDASVGGKTGVDLGVLKNQVGLFTNPEMVLVDTDYLKTVSEREIKSGMAEIIKYGLTYDADLYESIKKNDFDLSKLIYRSVAIKNEVVLQDPKEKNLRKILNFGHTIGHAVESYFLASAHKKTLTHGEAIGIGMICELYISSKLLTFPKNNLNKIKEIIVAIYGKNLILETEYSKIIDLLKHDKKNTNGQVNFVLLHKLEKCKIDCTVPEDLIKESLQYYSV